jgi:hypothetical protein
MFSVQAALKLRDILYAMFTKADEEQNSGQAGERENKH